MGITGAKWTKVRAITVNTDNHYILGTVSGIMLGMLVEDRIHGPIWRCLDDPSKCTFELKCNRWQYSKLKRTLESFYPGMCEFEP